MKYEVIPYEHQIKLINFDKGNIVPDGKYLVKTISPVLKTIQYLQARVKKVWHDKKEIFEMSVDVSNQTVTHISCKPLEL